MFKLATMFPVKVTTLHKIFSEIQKSRNEPHKRKSFLFQFLPHICNNGFSMNI